MRKSGQVVDEKPKEKEKQEARIIYLIQCCFFHYLLYRHHMRILCSSYYNVDTI